MENLKARTGNIKKKPKPQLHSSHLAMLYRCGIKFERVVLNGEEEPPGTPLIVGSATHAAIAINLTNKIQKKTLLTRDAVEDYASDEFERAWEESPVILTSDEKDVGLNKTHDYLKDETISLTLAHHYEIAPKVKPKAVEQPWVLDTKIYPYDLAGTWDIDEDIGIRDTKTKKINSGPREVHFSEQYTFYAMAKFVIHGIMPEYIIQDNLIKPTKTLDARTYSYQATRTKDDFVVAMKRFEQAIKIIEKEIFTPANPGSFDSPCFYCGFAADGSCEYFNNKRTQISMSTKNIKGEQNNEQSILTTITNGIEQCR